MTCYVAGPRILGKKRLDSLIYFKKTGPTNHQDCEPEGEGTAFLQLTAK